MRRMVLAAGMALALLTMVRFAGATEPAAATRPSADGDVGGGEVPLAMDFKPRAGDAIGGDLPGGAARGGGNATLRLCALAPAYLAYTTSPTPALVWWVDRPTDQPVQIRLSDPIHKRTVDVWQSSGTVARGVHVLRVPASASVAALPIGVSCQWSVSVIGNAAKAEKNLKVLSPICRVEPGDARAADHHAFYDALAEAADAASGPDPERAKAGHAALSALLAQAQASAHVTGKSSAVKTVDDVQLAPEVAVTVDVARQP